MPFTASIVTNCTQRKSRDVGADLADVVHGRNLGQLAGNWRSHVSKAPISGCAATLYQGRSIADVTAVAKLLSSPWYIVSAGLGLLSADEDIPAYECTVAPGSELSIRLKRLGATAADWWNALNEAHPTPLSRLIENGPTLLALPSTYLGMVRDDLQSVSVEGAANLRIFTSTAGASLVPPSLAACVMPYDERLESVPGYAGTRTDFAQRALRHFVEKLNAVGLSASQAHSLVASSLLRRKRPTRTSGVRMSDAEIRRVLKKNWRQYDGRSSKLLRYLRDEVGISCEQKRFSRIWQDLAAEMKA